jgi:hypothetical protein
LDLRKTKSPGDLEPVNDMLRSAHLTLRSAVEDLAIEMSRLVIYRSMLMRKGAINVAREAFERRDNISL